MSNLTPRPPHRGTRAKRVDRAYSVVVVGGLALIALAVSLVLALLSVIGAGVPLISLAVLIVCVLLFRRMVG